MALVLVGLTSIAHAQRPPPTKIPTVTIGTPVVTGPLDKDIVRRYLRRNAAKFQYCYEKHLVVDSKIKGTLKAAYEITAEGKVMNAGTMGVEGEVAACTKKVLEMIEYPKPRDGKSAGVKVDFVLKP